MVRASAVVNNLMEVTVIGMSMERETYCVPLKGWVEVFLGAEEVFWML